jgi:hypothetical protein
MPFLDTQNEFIFIFTYFSKLLFQGFKAAKPPAVKCLDFLQKYVAFYHIHGTGKCLPTLKAQRSIPRGIISRRQRRARQISLRAK